MLAMNESAHPRLALLADELPCLLLFMLPLDALVYGKDFVLWSRGWMDRTRDGRVDLGFGLSLVVCPSAIKTCHCSSVAGSDVVCRYPRFSFGSGLVILGGLK